MEIIRDFVDKECFDIRNLGKVVSKAPTNRLDLYLSSFATVFIVCIAAFMAFFYVLCVF